MKIELVVIGNEVLSGFTLNTNAAFIGRKLLKAGLTVSREMVIPDDDTEIRNGLKEALERADIVISTGGLGPTLDDLTRKSAARLFDSDFIYDANVAEDIKRRFPHRPPVFDETIKNQATVPSKADILLNPISTAPGFIFNEKGKTLIMLPGVPPEMEAMFTDQVIPYIQKAGSSQKKIFRKTLSLFELSETRVDPLLRELSRQYPAVNFSIYPSPGLLNIHLAVSADNAEAAEQLFSEPYSKLESAFLTNCYFSESGHIEEAIHHLFRENGWTLGIAESCTGGHAAARLVRLPGASDYFLGSIVSYSNTVKTKALGVPEALIREKGAVSKEVVEKMIEGVFKATGSDFALAVTGIAGPYGETSEKPIGTVWGSVCRNGEAPRSWELHAHGTREMIIAWSVNSLFSHLLVYTKETSLL